MDCFSILLTQKKKEAKNDRLLTIQLPMQSNSGTPDLKRVHALSPDIGKVKKKEPLGSVKKPLLLPQLSLTMEKRTKSINNSFRPSPKKNIARFAESGKLKRRPRPHSPSLYKYEDNSLQLRPASPYSSQTNTRNSPVISLRAKSPLMRFRQSFPSRHRASKSVFVGRL